MDKNEVNVAFEILLEEIEEVFNILIRDGEEAFRMRDFERARLFIENGEQIKAFREKVKSLQKEWQRIFSGRVPTISRHRRAATRLPRGVRTTEDEFKLPILESLVELGGKAEMKKVLEKVYGKMKNKLNQYDMSALPLNPKQLRWENTAQWARNTMVNEGLLAANSPRGIWEITEQGKNFLKAVK